jgi:hemerythrin superfamily protein
MTTADEPLDPWGMAWVHQVYRREFRLLSRLIAAVPEHDTARAAALGEHLGLIAESLHEHHVGEDELLWPLLLERAGLESTLIQIMQEQHDRLHEALQQIAGLTPRWAEKAAAGERDLLAEAVTRVSAVTEEHFAEEERHIMPLVREHITHDEWQAFEVRGHASIPQDKALIFLGLGLEDATGHEREQFLGGLPPEVLAFWQGPGQEQYKQWREQLLTGA